MVALNLGNVILSTVTKWQALGSYIDPSDNGKKKGWKTNSSYLFTTLPGQIPVFSLEEAFRYAKLFPDSTRVEEERWLEPYPVPNPQVPSKSYWVVPPINQANPGESPFLTRSTTDYQIWLNEIATKGFIGTPGRAYGGSNNTLAHYFRTYIAAGWGTGIFWTDNPMYRAIDVIHTHWHPANGVVGKKCPNNTCPVLCGNRVCCYNSNGISTNNFLYSESVYQ
jgi:hypothetical protein